MPEPTQVRSMFSRIAGSYDLLNRSLSMGIDQRWRRRAALLAEPVAGRDVVDVCCGTGDLAALFAERGARVVGVDFTPEMLERAVPKGRKAGRAVFVHGDALRLPLPDASADVATVAFGIRNVADRVEGLREMKRVLRPGGKLIVLEFTQPPGRVFGGLYRFYFTQVLPKLGGVVSGDSDAYSYLPRTVLAWPDPAAFQREFEDVGLEDCGYELLTRGIACLHFGRVPERT
ncbi:MAG: bifunctional demethylmenaquinone methyltransferase/2-methoxy-6-polyprenyl-1,4-benzoquinol methylase UbiE [Planctomycetes bacterium]|nr:bifunctional demethylmenaquinone methyltransferase/2-methoxy-6-polyprenyl-1,4-benzoquinol methylase UbiE [Planctomycetota bacterium]MCB9905352.1 bifunctional demethylmenaquinone methyltransferase/2-methoxy-6-polyprenyl-1,4-benzoquinol methylase UbiE [Planctomycetota bacterium]